MILDPSGNPIVTVPPTKPGKCPRCGAGRDKRQDISGFNARDPEWACGMCGYVFKEGE